MTRWTRPHVADLGMATTGALLVVGALLGLGLLVRFLAVTHEGITAYIPLPVVLAVVWRLHSIGMYTSDRGVRVRTFTRTVVLPWASIRGFESRPATLLGAMTRQEAVWIVSDTGAIEAPVRKHRGGMWDLARRELSPGAYRSAIRRLQEQLAERRSVA
jgi:hypothetical protein